MSPGGSTWPLVFLLPLVPLAGCITGGGAEDAFDDVAVPVWEPGFDWTYQVTTTERTSYEGSEGRENHESSHTAQIVLDVFNTTEPFGKEPAYYVRLSDQVDHPLLGPQYQAFAQDDLSLIGVGYGWYAPQYAEAVPVYAEDMYYVESPKRHDPCDGRPIMDAAQPEENPPGLTFPLAAGQVRSGTWGEEEDFGFAYRYRVRSLEEVTTPAGTFDAIHVAVTLIPSEARPDFGGDGFHATFDYWYAPDVRQIVKSVVTASADDFFDEGSFEYEAVQELTAFDLTPAPAEPAPVQRQETVDYPYVMREIVSNVELPVNVADGPAPVTFALNVVDDEYAHRWSYDSAIEPMDPLPTSEDLDATKYQVAWTIRDMYSWELVAEGVGNQFATTLDRGGQFNVNAEIQPLECGLPWLGSYSGAASTFWEKTAEFPGHPTGVLQEEIDVFDFPVEEGALMGTVQWSTTTPAAGPAGQSQPRVYDPTGQEVTPWNQDTRTMEFMPYLPGVWKVTWDSATPLTLLEEQVQLTLRVDYFTDDQRMH